MSSTFRLNVTSSRRQFLLASSTLPFVATRAAGAQSLPRGEIAFVKDGDIWHWTAESGAQLLHADGRAASPTWQPGENHMLFVREGGSFSNLVTVDLSLNRTLRLTDSESSLTPGSADYVADCVYIADPFWSESGIVCYGSNAGAVDDSLQLWIMRVAQGTTFPAPTDGAETGSIEKVTVDARGVYAAYTVTAWSESGALQTFIALRDLDTGSTYPLVEGMRGAYDAAISPDGDWVVASIRDQDGVSDLWIVHRANETATQLTFGEEAIGATWDPRGEWIAYLAYLGGSFSLRAFRVRTSGDEPSIDGATRTLIERDAIDARSRLSWNIL